MTRQGNTLIDALKEERRAILRRLEEIRSAVCGARGIPRTT